jgi:hypothetical protein
MGRAIKHSIVAAEDDFPCKRRRGDQIVSGKDDLLIAERTEATPAPRPAMSCGRNEDGDVRNVYRDRAMTKLPHDAILQCMETRGGRPSIDRGQSSLTQ